MVEIGCSWLTPGDWHLEVNKMILKDLWTYGRSLWLSLVRAILLHCKGSHGVRDSYISR